MTHYYVFNGDADGLCALQQLRRDALLTPGAERAPAPRLISGVKRDIELLQRVPRSELAPGESHECTVLDISLDKNRAPLLELLEQGVRVRYFDHHHAGAIPSHPHFEAHLDLSPTICTSLLVDRYLDGRQRAWALVGAFGDNLAEVATELARAHASDAATLAVYQELGVCLNYNAYGETLADLHVSPLELADEMLEFAEPLAFARSSANYRRIQQGYHDDMQQARRLEPERATAASLLFVVPDAAWARRTSGVLANELCLAYPEHAVAILSPSKGAAYVVSVRVPANAKVAADAFCRRFASGGGRRTAAGINHLPAAELQGFSDEFARQFGESVT